jgi:diguanylate cyclase (GGDEF)-like protein
MPRGGHPETPAAHPQGAVYRRGPRGIIGGVAPDRFRALVIDDDPGDTRLVREMLGESGFARFDVEIADRLAAGMQRLSQEDIDVVLVDLCLPDSQGVNTIRLLRAHAPEAPIVVLTGTTDEAAGVEALAAGAQEYLLKEQATGAVLVRALRYAIERKRLDVALQRMALLDDLTGLLNRRGFFQRAPRALRCATREQQRALVTLVDIDRLKQINDTYGHSEGDRAIITVAAVLRQTFRGDDVIGRLGGDEFAALALVKGPGVERAIVARLERNMAAARIPAGYPLSVSVGLSVAEAGEAADIEQLLRAADRGLYEHKRAGASPPPRTPRLLPVDRTADE